MNDVKKTVKTMMAARDYTFAKLADEYNKKFGTDTTRQAFAYKINHGALRASELIAICDILDFDLIVEAKDTHVRITS